MQRDLPELSHPPESRSVCPSCGALIGVNEVFCPSCQAPISLLANTDPLQRIYTEGLIYSKAVEGRPKLVVVMGIWILFLPVAILSCGAIVMMLGEAAGSGAAGFLFFWVAVFIAIFSIVMLFRVTRNYLRGVPPPGDKLD
jgi:hypothetical protein